MESTIKISVGERASVPKDLREAALAALTSHSAKSGGVAPERKYLSILASVDERIVGGLLADVLWNWLYADLVWVEEEFRGQGVGTRVMKRAEERALELKLTGIYLWTETWQAPGFYSKLGYTQFVEFKDFPPGHSRLGFYKYLTT